MVGLEQYLSYLWSHITHSKHALDIILNQLTPTCKMVQVNIYAFDGYELFMILICINTSFVLMPYDTLKSIMNFDLGF